MKSQDRIKLLENKKQTIQIDINNTVSSVIGLIAIATPIIIQIQLYFNNPFLSWIGLAVYLGILYWSGVISAVSETKNKRRQIKEIDNAIYRIITKQDIAEKLIENLYFEDN
jgi:hypothetical protein